MRKPAASLLSAVLALFIALPFALLLLLSLARDWRYPALWPQVWQNAQWLVFGDEWHSLLTLTLRSLLLAAGVALLATGAGFFTSHAIAHQRHARHWLALALLPFAVPPVVYALCLGQAYTALDLSGQLGGVVLAQWPFAYAYAVLLSHAYWTHHTLALHELAHSLGARSPHIWWRVHLPLARGVLGVCLFQTALISWFDFALVRVVGAGRVETLTLRVFDYLGAGDLRQAAAAALLLITPPLMALMIKPRLLIPAPLWRAHG
jgi:putative spermidine/putrescine transport system permease protein